MTEDLPIIKVDLHPTRGHDRFEQEFPLGVNAEYAHLPHAWCVAMWVCGTCGEVFFSDDYPQGTGLYARDHLQRMWDAHLTPDHPLP